MALLDAAVLLAEKMYIHYAPVGSIDPTADMVEDFDVDNPDLLGTGVSEVQTVTVSGTPTGGTFTLTFKGQTTAAIAYNAASTAVQSALRALSTIGSTGVTVSGTAGGPYTVTFDGTLAEAPQPTMTATSSLTGGTTPDVVATTTTEGGSSGGYEVWNHLGHTDLDEDIEGDQEGGKSEVRGTRQVSNLRVRDEPAVNNYTVNSVQVSPDALKLFYGGGTESAGMFVAPRTRKAQDLAVLIILVDGDKKVGIYFPKCSVKGAGPMTFEAENFVRFPLRLTPLYAPAWGTDEALLSNELFNTTEGDE